DVSSSDLELEEQIPQLAPRDWIDARGRLIQEQHARSVHERTGHGQTLTPATGELASAPVDGWFQMRLGNLSLAPLVHLVTAQAIKFSCKDEVLIHGQLVVERKFLRHVADHFLDRLGISDNIVGPNTNPALRRLENSAQHPDHGCFPGTIRAEKPEDRSSSDRE